LAVSCIAVEYATADTWLLLCDGGGSNNARHHIVKQELQRVADVIGKKLCIAHFPAYCSKYNPIEHRLFLYMTLLSVLRMSEANNLQR